MFAKLGLFGFLATNLYFSFLVPCLAGVETDMRLLSSSSDIDFISPVWIRRVHALGDNGAEEILAALERTDDEQLQASGLHAVKAFLWLQNRDPKTREEIRRRTWPFVRSHNKKIQAAALGVFSEVGPSAELPWFIELTNDSDPLVRKRALEVVLEIDEKQLRELENAVSDGLEKKKVSEVIAYVKKMQNFKGDLDYHSELRINRRNLTVVQRRILIFSFVGYQPGMLNEQSDESWKKELEGIGPEAIGITMNLLRVERHPLLQESLIGLLMNSLLYFRPSEKLVDEAIRVILEFGTSKSLGVRKSSEEGVNKLRGISSDGERLGTKFDE